MAINDGLHKNISVGENHVNHNWSVADAAAREALVLASTDIGKEVYQLDTKEFYRIVDVVATVGGFTLIGGNGGGSSSWNNVSGKPDYVTQAANATQDGYLTKEDFDSFNTKDDFFRGLFHLTPTISVTFDTVDDVPDSLQPSQYGFVTNSSTIFYNDNGIISPYAFSYLSILPNNKAGDWALIRENNTDGLKVFQYNPTTLMWVRTYPESIETPVITPDRYRGLITILQTNNPNLDPDYVGSFTSIEDLDTAIPSPSTGNVAKVSGIYLYYTGTSWEVATDYLIAQITSPSIGDYAQIRITPTSKAITYFYGTSWVAVPQEGSPKLKIKNTNYTFQLSEANYTYRRTTGNDSITWTIPANTSVEFELKTEFQIINSASGNLTIALNTDTLELNGVGVVTSFVVPQYASAYLVKIASDVWYAELHQPASASNTLCSFTAQTASYTLVLADYVATTDNFIETNVATANIITIPTHTNVPFPIGCKINVIQIGAGQTTITGDTGVTVYGTPGLKLRAQYSSVTLVKKDNNTWYVIGDLAA